MNEEYVDEEYLEEGNQEMVPYEDQETYDDSSDGQAGDLLMQAANLYSQCMQVEQKTEQIRMWSEVQIAKTVAKYRSCQEFLNFTFGERDKALTKHYGVLDKAVESGDRELIIAALKGISGIVTSSPLSDFDEFVKLYEDTTQPLLDF